jgi:hypothetical protein
MIKLKRKKKGVDMEDILKIGIMKDLNVDHYRADFILKSIYWEEWSGILLKYYPTIELLEPDQIKPWFKNYLREIKLKYESGE